MLAGGTGITPMFQACNLVKLESSAHNPSFYLPCINLCTILVLILPSASSSFFQVTRAILENPSDRTNVHLIYANVSNEDILLKVKLNLSAPSLSVLHLSF